MSDFQGIRSSEFKHHFEIDLCVELINCCLF